MSSKAQIRFVGKAAQDVVSYLAGLPAEKVTHVSSRIEGNSLIATVRREDGTTFECIHHMTTEAKEQSK